MELRQIRFALAVARHGAVRRAAETLNVDQAIVSAKTRDLEAELGVRLFERYSGGVRLTAPGELFVAGATKALRALEDTALQVRNAGRGQSGALTIGYVWSLAAGPGQDLLAQQGKAAPAVMVSLREQSGGELLAALMDRTLDVAFLIGDEFPARFERQRLWTEQLYLAVQEEAPVRQPVGWEHLDGHPLLVSTREDWTLYRRIAGRVSDPRLDPQFQDCSSEGIMALIAAGRGIAIVPAVTIRAPVPGVRFERIAELTAQCPVFAVWQRENDNPALKTFLSLVRKRFPRLTKG